MVSVYCVGGACTKCAVTDLSPVIVTDAGFADPDTLPLQWSNNHPAAGVAVSVTIVPSSYVWVPADGLVDPLPSTAIVSVYCVGGACTKCAVTDLSPVIVTDVGFADPDTLPLQWSNNHPAAGVAVSVTIVPSSYVWVPTDGLVDPLPSTAIVSVYCVARMVTEVSPETEALNDGIAPWIEPPKE